MFRARVSAVTVSVATTLAGLESDPVRAKSSGLESVPVQSKSSGFGFGPSRAKSLSFGFSPSRGKSLSFGFGPSRAKSLGFGFGPSRAKSPNCIDPHRTTSYLLFMTRLLCKAISAPFKGPLNPFPFKDKVFTCHSRMRLLLPQLTTIDETYGWSYV